MLTVHPSIILGSFLWDEERLPRDEFDIRMQPLKAAMQQNGWAATLVYGDAREHAALAYFSNFIPRMRWAMALFPDKGEPLLLCSMSSRDVPAMQTMTWIKDVKSGWEWQWIEQFIARLGPGGTIGTIGFDDMTPLLTEGVMKRLGSAFKLEVADDVCAQARATQRPREIATIREATAIVRIAADAASTALRAGEDPVSAALKAERTARSLAAHDVRTLISLDGGHTFHANMQRPGKPTANALIYLGVKYLGYWSQTWLEHGMPLSLSHASRKALEALIGGMRVGASLDQLAQSACAELGGLSMHPAISGKFGCRIGLSPCEGGEICEGSVGVVEPNTVYALNAGVTGANGEAGIASALVVTRASGACDVIDRSWKPGA